MAEYRGKNKISKSWNFKRARRYSVRRVHKEATSATLVSPVEWLWNGEKSEEKKRPPVTQKRSLL